jgi:hypothetical protein
LTAPDNKYPRALLRKTLRYAEANPGAATGIPVIVISLSIAPVAASNNAVSA